MRLFRIILLSVYVLVSLNTMAQQKEMRQYLRSGNRYYKQDQLKKAESEYYKAYEIDSMNTQVLYNLGTDLMLQQDIQHANEMLVKATQTTKAKNKLKGHQIYHNLGVTLQAAKQYDKAIAAYKQALRCDPKDEETRYNLVLCQKLLKDQQQNQQNQQQQKNQDQNKQDKQQQQEQQKNEQQKQEEQEQNMSKENAQQLLEAVKQEEKEFKNRMNQQMQQAQPNRRKKQKDW